MHLAYLFTAALASMASAQTTVISMLEGGSRAFISEYPLQNLVGSIINVDAVATTFAIGCAPNAPIGVCQIQNSVTAIEGPSTWSRTGVYAANIYGEDLTATINQGCTVTSSTTASCSATVVAEITALGESTTTTTVVSNTLASDEITYEPLTVTAGVSKLHTPGATQTPAAAAAVRTGMPLAAAAAAVAVVGLL